MAQFCSLTPVSSSVPAPHCSLFLLSSSPAMSPFPVPRLPGLAYFLLRIGQRLSSFVLVPDLLLFLPCTSQQLPRARYCHSIKHVLEKAALSVSHMMTYTFGFSREKSFTSSLPVGPSSSPSSPAATLPHGFGSPPSDLPFSRDWSQRWPGNFPY